MARDLTASVITEVTAITTEPVVLGKFEFDGGDLNLWTGIGNISFGGDVYTGAGDLVSVGTIVETQLVKAAGLTLGLSGIPSSIIAVALTENYQERPATLWLGFLDSSKALISDPFIIFSGRMDVMEIDEKGELANIRISLENRLVDLERPKTRWYTPEDQKDEFPGDLFFDFVPTLNDGRQVIWGN